MSTLVEVAATLEAHLVSEVARQLRIPLARVDPGQPLSGMGLDSLSAIELQQALEADFGVSPALSGLLEGASVRDLAAEILAKMRTEIGEEAAGRSAGTPVFVRAAEEPVELPLSAGQRGLWFLSRLAPESGAYNIVSAARVWGGLDAAALERSLRALVARHGALRTTFPSVDGEPLQRVAGRTEPVELDFAAVDAAGWEEEREAAWLAAEGFRSTSRTGRSYGCGCSGGRKSRKRPPWCSSPSITW
jgi:acyl carrier protein